MTPSTLMLRPELEKRLPHRFENFLIDSVTAEGTDENMTASLKLTILPHDSLDRQLFSRRISKDTQLLINPVFMEVLALASIARIGPTEGHTFVFSGISNFEYHAPYRLGATLLGSVKKTGAKGPFILVDGALTDETGHVIAKGSLMSALIPTSSLSGKAAESEPFQPEDQLQELFTYKKPFKDAAMVMCDRVLQFNANEKTALTSYIYPTDHPCVRGHFPEAPIMMGIMQLIFLEDSCFAIRSHLPKMSNVLRGNACIMKEDGSHIAQIKGFSVEFLDGDYAQPQLTELKKVSFKGIAEPGDRLFLMFDSLEQ